MALVALVPLLLLAHGPIPQVADSPAVTSSVLTTEHEFQTYDEHSLFGKLSVPSGGGRHPVVVYVQTAEGMTVDMKRQLPQGGTFNYFDLYASKLPPLSVGFFRYEGRGIRMGTQPPRYEEIEREVYDTSTLENKVRDVLSAVSMLAELPSVDPTRIYLLGASEGTLLAAEAAARSEGRVAGLILYGSMSGTLRDLFRYIMTDGGFLTYRGFFDTDDDGRISPEEFEADPQQYRARVFQGAPFAVFDRDEDGFFTAADMPGLTRPYLNAIDQDNYAVLDNWARTAAGVATPSGWFQDHFEHEPIWTFLAPLDIPIGFFHGIQDNMAPVEGVRELERRAQTEGRTNLEFHYFEGLDHSLGIMNYFLADELPEGHVAIFDFIARTAHAEESPEASGESGR
jgi:pimeloyl-ACP methyl ester carboxylesterase